MKADVGHSPEQVSEKLKAQKMLGRKLVFFIILVNAVLSVFTSGIQLYLSYDRDRDKVLDSINIIDKSFRTGFEDALWEYNYGLAEALLDGVYNRADVEYVDLLINAGKRLTRGEQSSHLILDTLSFSHTNQLGIDIPVGELTIGLSLENVQARIWAQFWTLMLSNFAKTALASVIMLILFNTLVSRHLKTIAQYVSETSWLKAAQPLTLKRSEKHSMDDLDYIVNAINTAKVKSAESFEILGKEIKQRRIAEGALSKKAIMLEQTNEKLMHANREQAEFTYAISHDLKSPTNTVNMLLDELNHTHIDTLDDDAKGLIKVAQNTVKRMGILVEDILHYSTTIEEDIVAKPVKLNVMLAEIINDMQADIKDSCASIQFDPLPVIYGSSVQLRILFQNLINNALKFRSPERELEIKIHCRVDEKNNRVNISVSDNGIGIEPKYSEKVFGLFQRLHTHNTYPGSGIGLTLCKRIVTNHHGQISVNSVPDQGATFEISLRKK